MPAGRTECIQHNASGMNLWDRGRSAMSRESTSRWSEEAAFFDRVASQASQAVLPMDVLILQRFGSPSLRRRFNKEFRFRTMGDLHGKQVLDIGCGDGSHSILLAKFGARVTGVDVSPKSIDLARRRAQVNEVTDSVRFVYSPLERAEFPPEYFDLIWGDAVLHHLIEELELTMQKLTTWAKPGALMVFAEPVNFNQALRRFRLMLPVKADATPGERPLERAEVEIIRRSLPDFQMRFFSLFGRLNRFILIKSSYERSSFWRRAIANAITCLDYGLLSMPAIRNLGGSAVLYGHVSRAS
jgi:2-polyprenyl-3-methyl-5-hydroxy-6-metoxy-1,4-benzoquinol methylase